MVTVSQPRRPAGAGFVEGVAATLGAPITTVHPTEWQRSMKQLPTCANLFRPAKDLRQAEPTLIGASMFQNQIRPGSGYDKASASDRDNVWSSPRTRKTPSHLSAQSYLRR